MLSESLWKAYIAGSGAIAHWREMAAFAALPTGERRLILTRRLWEQIQYFGRRADALPEWREAAQIRDPLELWWVWRTLPIVTKHDLRTRFHPEEIRRRFRLEGEISRTGGSTGEPTAYLHYPAMQRATTAARLYARRRMGWRPGMPTICVWGSERDIGGRRSLRKRISGWLRNDHLIDGYNLDGATADRVLEITNRFPQVALYGFTSMLEFVAREVVRRGAEPAGRVAVAWNGGEVLLDTQAEIFKRAFAVPLLDLYGGRELSAMAYQPAEGAPLKVLRPLVMVEVVEARLIWTSTVCRGTPFLRYDIGDLGAAAEEDESGIGSIGKIQGRYAGLLRTPNGRTINCIYWNHLFKEFGEIEQFQVALRGDRSLELRFKGRPMAAGREEQLRRVLGGFLGDLPVRVRWVERIPLTPQGKHVQVVTEP